ncbi:hypothetical protein, partial [Carnobacterium sp.]|uniref:hypothetical protein n=1 Tax=Carnobacterium sp. TaxID=48221 RepID=UPI0028B23639
DNNYNKLGDRLYNWYHSLDFDIFSKECLKKISLIDNENKKFEKKLDDLLIKKGGKYENKD